MTREDALALAELQTRSFAAAGRGARRSWPREAALDADGLLAFLDRPPFAVLATGTPEGRPRAAPIAIVVHDAAFWAATVAGARVRDLRRLPYVSLVVSEGGSGSHRMVKADGPVSLHDPAPWLLDLWRDRLDEDAGWAAAFLELRPERLFSYRS